MPLRSPGQASPTAEAPRALPDYIRELPLTVDRHTGRAVSSQIDVRCYEARNHPGQSQEEQGVFLLQPSDGAYEVQLLFVQYNDALSERMTLVCIGFNDTFFRQFPLEELPSAAPFLSAQPAQLSFSISPAAVELLQQVCSWSAADTLIGRLRLSSIALELLGEAVQNILLPFNALQLPACRFLKEETERDKIVLARSILDRNYDESITIRELSRKVAMNECYLKKGFKALTGKTIHEYQHSLRISKARELLQLPGYSVADVATRLGFSSISHFSTAFKKATGLKPCELLS